MAPRIGSGGGGGDIAGRAFVVRAAYGGERTQGDVAGCAAVVRGPVLRCLVVARGRGRRSCELPQ